MEFLLKVARGLTKSAAQKLNTLHCAGWIGIRWTAPANAA